jgi:hypothetical protein
MLTVVLTQSIKSQVYTLVKKILRTLREHLGLTQVLNNRTGVHKKLFCIYSLRT